MKKLIISISMLCLAAISISAQFESEGKLNIWTTKKVQRIYRRDLGGESAAATLCKVRVAKNKGFDRVVFEFDGGTPQYVVEFLPSNIYTTDGGDEKIKIAGNVFMLVSIYGMGALDELPCKLESYPNNKLDFPALMQIREAVWSEGIQDFLIGVKAKKSFRIQELSNPSRLVIDFKH